MWCNVGYSVVSDGTYRPEGILSTSCGKAKQVLLEAFIRGFCFSLGVAEVIMCLLGTDNFSYLLFVGKD